MAEPIYFTIFAYPGVTGLLHLGHMRGATYTDILQKYSSTFKNKKIFFPTGIHATGNGPIQLFSKIQSLKYRQEQFEKKGFFISPKGLTSIKAFVSILKKEYYQTWKKMGFGIDKLQITTLEKQYQIFVKWSLNMLSQKNLIKKTKYALSFCTICGPVSVDSSETDLSSGGDAKKITLKIKKIKNFDLKDIYVLVDADGRICSTEFEKFKDKIYDVKILRFKQKKGESIANSFEDVFSQYKFKSSKIEYWTISTKLDKKIVSFTKPVFCRCYRPIFIKLIKNQEVLKYSDEDWKKKTIDLISKTEFQPSFVKEELKKIVQNYHDRPFTRQGNWLGTKYGKNKVIEAITDSTLYPLFYALKKAFALSSQTFKLSFQLLDFIFFNKKYNPTEKEKKIKKETIAYSRVDLNVIGKEHIYVHIPTSLFFYSLFDPIFSQKAYLIHWYVVSTDKTKLSKSKGNAPTSLLEYIKKYSEKNIRLFLCSNVSYKTDLEFSKEKLKIVARKEQKFRECILSKKKFLNKNKNCAPSWGVHSLVLLSEKIKKSLESFSFEIAFSDLYDVAPSKIEKLDKSDFCTPLFKSCLFELIKLHFVFTNQWISKKVLDNTEYNLAIKKLDIFESEEEQYTLFLEKFSELYSLISKKIKITSVKIEINFSFYNSFYACIEFAIKQLQEKYSLKKYVFSKKKELYNNKSYLFLFES